ncbi:hypothetical protein PTQ97_22975 [Serratia ureilytica]|uniref:hypothetical protein n=1 Tax=Serratia ureilytica TaxID=300181 RepID=UPI00313E0F78
MSKKFILFSLSVISMALSACDDNSHFNIKENEPKVFYSDEKIFYSGDVSESGLKKVQDLSNNYTTTLVINSRGGDIVPGMKLGELVFDKKWNVQVQDYCFSSCANYIFPAGSTKYLSKGSQLGWHGGATQQFSDDIVPKEQGDRKRFIQTLIELIKLENNFFNKITVNQLSTVYGLTADNYLEMLKSHNKNCKGWSYSIDGLSAFGINNIVLLDGEWHPSPSYENSCIHTFEKVLIK